MDEETTDLLTPNTRPASVKRFLAKPPLAAKRMVLTTGTDQGTSVQLGEWDIGQVLPLLALEIDAMMLDHATTLNAHVMGALIFYDENNRQVGGTKILKYRPESSGTSSDSLASLPSQLTGDSTSQAAQAQRHLEVMQRMMLTAIGGLFVQMRQNNEHTMELCETLATRLAESETRERRAKQEKDAIEEELTAIVSAEGTDGTAQAQDRIMKLLEPVIPLLVQKLATGGK